MTIIVHCSYCGKELHRRQSQAKKAKKHFCNKDHFQKYRVKYNYYAKNTKHHYMKFSGKTKKLG